VNKLILVRSLRERPEKLLVDFTTVSFIESIDKHSDYNHLHNIVDGPRGNHVHRKGYNCLTKYPSKPNT
jgi:hypothetical protein